MTIQSDIYFLNIFWFSKNFCLTGVSPCPFGVHMVVDLRPPGILMVSMIFRYFHAFLNGCPPGDPVASIRCPFGIRLKLSVFKNGLPSRREGMAPISSHSFHCNITSHTILNLIPHPSVGEYFPLRLYQECLVYLLKTTQIFRMKIYSSI